MRKIIIGLICVIAVFVFAFSAFACSSSVNPANYSIDKEITIKEEIKSDSQIKESFDNADDVRESDALTVKMTVISPAVAVYVTIKIDATNKDDIKGEFYITSDNLEKTQRMRMYIVDNYIAVDYSVYSATGHDTGYNGNAKYKQKIDSVNDAFEIADLDFNEVFNYDDLYDSAIMLKEIFEKEVRASSANDFCKIGFDAAGCFVIDVNISARSISSGSNAVRLRFVMDKNARPVVIYSKNNIMTIDITFDYSVPKIDLSNIKLDEYTDVAEI